MFDPKPYGAFVENTNRPLLEELKPILIKHDFNSEKLTKLVWITGWFHIFQTFIKSFFETLSIAIAVYFICKISAS